MSVNGRKLTLKYIYGLLTTIYGHCMKYSLDNGTIYLGKSRITKSKFSSKYLF